MPDIKRPNYFTSQFLVDKDFNDEQAYHLNTRRRQNRVLHTGGVADGLDVTRVSATQVQIAPGTAIDTAGREIMLDDARTYTLVTAGNDLNVFLTMAYQEVFDPADHYTQGGLDKFTRTTERPLFQDGTGTPPTDGSVIVLAKIHLNATGAIESNSSIDETVRTLASAKVAPKSVTTAQLADGAVTLAKLASETQPLTPVAANAVTVVVDNTAKRLTIGESHSARTDNPHATTAAQIDAQGGANGLVTQINAGTGVITRAHLQSAVVSGVMTFQNLAFGSEMVSNDIDPGFGSGAMSVQLALDDTPAANITLAGDTNYARTIALRAEINRATGRFRIFANRTSAAATANVLVRWYAFIPQAGTDGTTAIGVVVSPTTASLISNTTQTFTATINNTSNTQVIWAVTEANGGTLSALNGPSVTYTPPGLSGTYHVVATSAADGTRKATATVVVNADVTVTITPNNPTVFRGATQVFNASVVNTPTTGVTWSIQQGASGGTIVASGNSATYTAPTVPGTYTVVATSAADGTKKGTVTITVPPVTISISADSDTVSAGGSTVVRATIGGSTDNRANWTSQSLAASVSPALGPTTTWFAPGVGGSFGVIATAVADTSKSDTTTITVPPVKSPTGEGGGGKFAPVQETISVSSPALAKDITPAPVDAAPDAAAPTDAAPDAASDAESNARSFVRPAKRSSKKPPPEPGNA